jgi:tetratricopeptide (TPR) repeat protein
MEKSLNNSEKSLQTDNILSLAEGLREKSLYQQSLKLFKQALKRLTGAKDPEGIYHCMLASGDLYRMTGDFGLAARSYMDAVEVASQLKSPLKVADAKVGLGLSLRAQGKWREAIKLIGKSKKIYGRKNDTRGIAFTLWAGAGALRIKGDITGAIKAFRKSHKIFKSMKDPQGIGYCLCGIGGASRMSGRFRESLKYYTAANRLFSSERDRFGKAYSYCGIGNAYRMLGEYKNAFAYFTKATRLYKKMGDRVSYAYTLWGLGTAYKMTGAHNKARDYFMKAMRLFKTTKDPRGIIYCELGFGELSLLKGRKATARKFFSAALNGTTEHMFALEKCHAETLISFINETSSSGNRGTKKSSGKIKRTCYDRLNLKLGFEALPLNIP